MNKKQATMKRRQILVGLGLATLASPLLARSVAAQDKKATPKHEVEYLFVQNAKEAHLADGVLTLKGVNPSTLYFSDRPDRIVGHVTTRKFVGHWATGKDSFEVNPPNAVLTILAQNRPEWVVAVLKNPRLKGGALVYDIEILDGPKKLDGGPCSLFIDTIGRPLTPLSVAGVHRRRRRRAIRRHN